MQFGNIPKFPFAEYWQKYSNERKIIKDDIITKGYSVLRALFWVIYQPYKWLFIVPFLVVSTSVLASLTMTLSYITSPKIADPVAVFWARVNSFFTPMSVVVSGAENIESGRSYVITANHSSLYDIYALYGWLGISFKWVMKKELERVPFIGPVCKSLGHIFIDRSDSAKAIQSLNAARSLLTNGTSVIFFPEGSRSNDGFVGPFKKGAFKMAIDLGLPVLPVTLNGTEKILPKGTTNLMPGTVELIIHEPIPVEHYTSETLSDLMDTTRMTIISGQSDQSV